MKAGPRTSLISIERATVTGVDGLGGEVSTWAEYAAEYAQIIYGTGQERRDAAQERASIAATFRVLANPLTRAVTPRDRVLYDTFVWDVISSVPLGRDGVEITAVTSFEVLIRLAGTIAGQGTLTGGLSVSKPLAGLIASQGSLAGTLTVSAPLAGTIAGQGAATGTIQVSAPLAGAIIAASSFGGTIQVSAPLAGAIMGTSNFSGTVTLGVHLAGGIAGVGSLSGSLGVDHLLAGLIAGSSSLSGTLTAAAPTTARQFMLPTASVLAANGTRQFVANDAVVSEG